MSCDAPLRLSPSIAAANVIMVHRKRQNACYLLCQTIFDVLHVPALPSPCATFGFQPDGSCAAIEPVFKLSSHLLDSLQHLASLLAAPHVEVVLATLQVLTAFLKKTHHVTIRWHGYPALNARLLRMCKGWGGKEDGLDLVTSTSSAITPAKQVCSRRARCQCFGNKVEF